LYFYSASSLKQQSVGKHVTPHGHIILISSRPVFGVKQQIPILYNLFFTWSGLEPIDLPHPMRACKLLQQLYLYRTEHLIYIMLNDK